MPQGIVFALFLVGVGRALFLDAPSSVAAGGRGEKEKGGMEKEKRKKRKEGGRKEKRKRREKEEKEKEKRRREEKKRKKKKKKKKEKKKKEKKRKEKGNLFASLRVSFPKLEKEEEIIYPLEPIPTPFLQDQEPSFLLFVFLHPLLINNC